MNNHNRHRKLQCEQLEARQMLTTFFVDGPGGDGPGGNDITGSGLSENSAFATIQRAADIAGAGDTILIRGGTYREQVSQPRSGAGDLFPITYQAYNGEDVVVSGGDHATNWTQVAGDIWKATVAWNANNNRENNTLFVNGELKIEARQFAESDPLDINTWGALQSGSIAQGGTTILLDELQGDPASKWIGAKVRFHTTDYSFETKTITGFNSSTGLATLDSPIGFISQKQTNGYYLFDTIEALDKPGEWFKDSGNTLYYHAEPGQDPNNLEIEFKSRGYGFDLRGRSSIIIDGITFRGVSIYADASSNNNTYENNVFYGYGKGPSNNFGRFYIIGEDNIFRGNEVYLTYGGAFDLDGRGNHVVNNYFHDTGINGLGGVISSRGSEQLIAYNTVQNFARSFADGYSTNSEYAYNVFEDGGNLSWDTGVFDADGTNGDSSFSVFHHNVFRNTNARGIFLAVYGRNNNAVFHHNFIYDFSGVQAPFSAGGINFRQGYHNTIIGTAPATLGVDTDQRAAVQTRYNNSLQISLENISASGIDTRGNHNYSPSDFFDLNARDLRLAAGSGAIDVGIVLPGINDGYAGDAPDAGALEFGESMWEVGHDFVDKPNPDYNWSLLPGMNLYTNPQFLQGIGDWTINSGTPHAADRSSWDLKENSLTGSSRTASVEFLPDDSISRTFTGLKPDTTYTLGGAVRVVEEVVSRGDQFSASAGSVATGVYRDQPYVTGLTSGEWVRFDNIDFGDTYQFDQIEVIHGRNAALNPIEGATIQVRLDSPTGPVIGEFSSLIDNHFWYSATDDLPPTSGTHSIYVSASGPNSQNVAISLVRLLKQNPPERDKLTLNVATPGSPTKTAGFGQARWALEYETAVFQTGPTATAATVTFTNNGRINNYLDRIYLVEGDTAPTRDLAQLYGEARQSSTASGLDASLALDGEINTFSQTQNLANSWWQIGFPEDSLIGEIELVNQSTSSYGDLSNFTVSVWDGDPETGGVKQWEKAYFASGRVAKGETLRITGSEVGDDGQTRLASALGSHIRVQINGLNNNGNGNLSLADVNVLLATDAPPIENVAHRGKATESSDFYRTFRIADWALDGKIETFSHTESETGWWQVELEETVPIDQLVVFNTTRFGSFRMSVWAADPQAGGNALWSRDYFVGSDEIITVNGSETSSGNQLDSFTNARYFRIDRLNSGFLALDEVQIWSNDTVVGGIAPTAVNLNATSYRYDFGTQSSPVEHGFQKITPDTFGDISWTTPVQALDRGPSSNDLDRDFAYLTADGSTLRHRIANGTWEVTLRMGDNNVARDDMTIRAEGELINDNIDAAAGSFATVGRSGTSDQSFLVTVTDGFLDLEFHDNGGNADWVVNSLEISAAAGTAESDLSLEIDELTGEAYLANRTSDAISLEGYSIVDPNDGLAIATWLSLDDSNYDSGAWLEANPTSGTLSELNPLATTVLASGESVFIGTIVDPIASPSLRLLYFTEGQEDASPGFVLYTAFTSTPGDFNDDSFVDHADLLQWQGDYGISGDSDADNDGDSDGSDFLAWQRSYNPSVPVVAAASLSNVGDSSVDVELAELDLPTELPTEFTTTIEYQGETLTLNLDKNSIFGENTKFFVDTGSGELVQIDHGLDRSYLGTVAEYPTYMVSAWLSSEGLRANVIRPNMPSLLVEPLGVAARAIGPGGGAIMHQVSVDEAGATTEDHDHDGDGIQDHVPGDHTNDIGGGHPPDCACSLCCGGTTSSSSDLPAALATLPPARTIEVREYEIGVEIGSNALNNNYNGATLQDKVDHAMDVAAGIPGNLDARFLRAAGIKHRLGTVIVRTTSDPFTVSNGNDSGGLSAFRNYWNNLQANEGIAPTHDLAVYHVRSAPSGLAYVNSVGSSNRYALTASNGPTSWADGTLAHEFGHSWSLGHVPGGTVSSPDFYEARPRSNGNAAGGDDFFISIMHGGGNHNSVKLSTGEANRVLNAKSSKLSFGDVVASVEVAPFGAADAFNAFGGPITIDVIANDYDANNDVLDVQVRDTVSFMGGTISLSNDTGPGGRNELIYTPPADLQGRDFFHYTVVDSTGRADWGAVYVTVDVPLENLGAYQFDFGPNINGTYAGTESPRFVGETYTNWNSVTRNDADVNTVVDAEGNASNVTLKVRETTDGGTFDFAAPGSGLEDRTATNYTGLYGTQLMTDLMFTRNNDDLGIQIDGLPSGEYAVFAMLREPDASTRTYSVDIGVGTSETVSHGDFGLGNATTLPADDPVFWVDNQNYYTETVSVGSGDSLFVLIDSTDSEFVSLQGLQVVRLTSPLNFEVDSTTGRAALHNISDELLVIDGYAITSSTNSLRPEAWQSLDDQEVEGSAWIEFLATNSSLVEANPTGTTTIAPGERFVLGSIYDVNDPESIDFSFTSPELTGEIFIPVVFDTFANPADFDLDQDVDGVDLTTWLSGFGQNGTADTDADGDSDGSDFLFWQRNFGAGLGGASFLSAASTSSPAVHRTDNLSVLAQSTDLQDIGVELSTNYTGINYFSRQYALDAIPASFATTNTERSHVLTDAVLAQLWLESVPKVDTRNHTFAREVIFPDSSAMDAPDESRQRLDAREVFSLESLFDELWQR